jgi:hypothetical protein
LLDRDTLSPVWGDRVCLKSKQKPTIMVVLLRLSLFVSLDCVLSIVRSLPSTGILAMAFFRHVAAFDIQLYYGAFESLGTAREVRAAIESDAEYHGRHAAPIFDLTAMFDIPPWGEAVSEWKRTGRADGLVERTGPYLRDLKKRLKGAAPAHLTALPKKLQLLDDALALVRHDKIGQLADEALSAATKAGAEVSGHPPLAPLSHLLETIGDSIRPLVGPGHEWQSLTDGYLRHQAAVAHWMATHGRVVEGFSFVRELVISCAGRIALAAGLDSIHDSDPATKEFRASADGMCAKLSGAAADSTLRGHEQELAPPLRDWLSAHADVCEAFRIAYADVHEYRNRLDHCWVDAEHVKKKFNEATRKEFAERLARSVRDVDSLIELIAAKAPLRSVRGTDLFLNLSNHPMVKWTEEQIAATRELGLGEPAELEEGMPLVPPGDDASAILQLARDVAERAAAAGAAGAFVATDFTLTLALVVELQRRGIRCFAATTERVSKDIAGPDGSVERVSNFRFVRWREYLDARS